MIDIAKVQDNTIYYIVSVMGGLYIASFIGVLTQISKIRQTGDKVLNEALEKFRHLMAKPKVQQGDSTIYTELVDAYKRYRRLLITTSTCLFVASFVGVVLLVVSSLITVGFSKGWALFLAMLLSIHTLVIVVAWIVSWLKAGAWRL